MEVLPFTQAPELFPVFLGCELQCAPVLWTWAAVSPVGYVPLVGSPGHRWCVLVIVQDVARAVLREPFLAAFEGVYFPPPPQRSLANHWVFANQIGKK